MKVTQLITKLAELAGQKENAEIQALIGASGIQDFELSDEIANGLFSKILTEESAKANVSLKNHFLSQLTQGLNQDIEETAKELGANAEELAAIKSEPSTGKKVKLYQKALSRLVTEAQKKGNSEEFTRKIQEAESRVQAVETEWKTRHETETGKLINELANRSISAALAGVQWNEAIPDVARIPAFTAALEAELAKMEGQLIFDTQTYQHKVVNKNDPTLPVMLQNKPVGFDDVKSLALQAKKLLKEAGNGGGGNPPIPPNPPGNPNGQKPGTPVRQNHQVTSMIGNPYEHFEKMLD